MRRKEHNALYEPSIGPLMFGPILLRGRRSVNVSHLALSCRSWPFLSAAATRESRRETLGPRAANAAGLLTFLPRSKCDRVDPLSLASRFVHANTESCWASLSLAPAE